MMKEESSECDGDVLNEISEHMKNVSTGSLSPSGIPAAILFMGETQKQITESFISEFMAKDEDGKGDFRRALLDMGALTIACLQALPK